MKRTIIPAALLAALALPVGQPDASPAVGAVTRMHRNTLCMVVAMPGADERRHSPS